MTTLETRARHQCFGGYQGFYSHHSETCSGPMAFSVFVPPHEAGDRLPVVYYLSGLTCDDEVFAIKAGAQRVAAELGLVLVAPDTSPRDTGIPGATDEWDFGEGAGFYVDATEAPWSDRFNMYSYVTRELPAFVAEHFPVDPERSGVFGHSMGGHGALVVALRNPDRYRSVSAFAPIAAPARVPWGRKAFPRYLGDDESRWKDYDASELVREHPFGSKILVDQGLDDAFLEEQLKPDLFVEACEAAGQRLELRKHPGYDHGYFFVQTFVEDHLGHHAAALA